MATYGENLCGGARIARLFGRDRRGIVEAQTANQTVWQAVFNLVAFGFVGLLVGRIAQWTVDDSIRSQLATQMQARPSSGEQAPRAAA